MTDVTLEAMMRRLARTTEDMFNDCGEIDSCWLVDIPGEGQKLIVTPISIPPGITPGEYKQRLHDGLRNMFEQMGVTRYVCAQECWIAGMDDGSKEWAAEHGSLANFPGRQEAITIHAEDGERFLFAVRTIVRPAQGKPYLTKLEIEQPPSRPDGRFTGLLPARPVLQ